MAEDYLKGLREFSQELLSLGRDIEANLKKKQELEELIKRQELEIRKMESDTFALRSELRKVEMELASLEEKRSDIEKKKNNGA